MTGRTVVLQLGGNLARAVTAAQAARVRPGAVVVVSSQRYPASVLAELERGGLYGPQVYLDFTAWDTVTNFTHTRALLADLGCDRLCVVTSARHMPRALAVARTVYWGTGLSIIPVPHVDTEEPEAWWLRPVDVCRALVWRLTGWVPSVPAVKRRILGQMTAIAADARRIHDPARVTP